MNMYVYDLVKAVHVVAVIIFSAGVLIAAIVIRAIGQISDGRSALLVAVQKWDAQVTTPAMVVVWGLGIVLMTMGNWFPSPWLIAKLVLVFVLSGIHGVNSGRLRRFTGNAGPASRGSPPIVVLGIAASIVLLVILKPF